MIGVALGRESGSSFFVNVEPEANGPVCLRCTCLNHPPLDTRPNNDRKVALTCDPLLKIVVFQFFHDTNQLIIYSHFLSFAVS